MGKLKMKKSTFHYDKMHRVICEGDLVCGAYSERENIIGFIHYSDGVGWVIEANNGDKEDLNRFRYTQLNIL